MRRFLLSLAFFIAVSRVVSAQIDFSSLEEYQIYRTDSTYNTWSISLGYGPVFYYTDVNDYTLFPSSNLKLGPSVQIAKQLGRSWSIVGEFLMADMYGQKYQRYFEGDFREASLNLVVYLNQLIFNGPVRDKWNIYTRMGLGLNYFRSSMREQGSDRLLTVNEIFGGISGYPTSYSDWDANDYLVMGYKRNGYSSTEPDLEEIGRESGLVVPVSIGVRYRVNRSFDFGVEASLHNMVNDDIDIDLTGADNDSYMHTSFSLVYKFGKKNKRHASWTYKDFNLSYERDRLNDPLALKLDSLRKQLDELAAVNDSAIGDTIYVSEDVTIQEESIFASVFFDFDKADVSSYSHRRAQMSCS